MSDSLQQGHHLELAVEKPAAGGRMIARHEGRVFLVLGAIPGERVLARVTKVERQVAFAETLEVLEPASDRRAAAGDPGCGGCLYAHVSYARQLALKGEVIGDAFLRLGRIALPAVPEVEPSAERGYRMRARLHVRGARVGFYREGTHELCEPRQTGQLTDAAIEAAERAVTGLVGAGHVPAVVEVAENMAADERVLHVILSPGTAPGPGELDGLLRASATTGLSVEDARGVSRTTGIPVVRDPLSVLTGGRAAEGALERHAESFFQANRFVLPRLVVAVLDAVQQDGEVLDLYAGVGLFSLALAACGWAGITAVEGDRSSGRDLQRNASQFASRVRVALGSVEEYLRKPRGRPAATALVDPPRTGMSRAAVQLLAAYGARRIVYVSCDPATMARDARRLLDAGYGLGPVRAFDLFPNTPHVETLAVFDAA